MTTQLALDLPALVVPEYEPEMTLVERYVAWSEVNGHVIAEFERRTAQLVAAGRRRVGMKMVAEAIRFDMSVRSDGEPWAVNNSYVALIARDLIERHPEWADFIETRRSCADEVSA